MTSKVCICCGEDKDTKNFGRKKGNNGNYYLRGRCSECHTAYNLHNRRKVGRKTSPKTLQNARIRASKYYYEQRETPSFKFKVCALAAKYRAQKLKATPKWLTKLHHEDINNFYWLSKDLTAVSGEDYHVDHIVPLKGKNICGLHVPWNLQILPADINLSKGNRYANDA